MKLLITGGAGYIGSHMVRYAQDMNHDVVVLDNFSTGHRWAVKDCEIIDIDLINFDGLSKKLKGFHFDGVIHFAAKSLVGESIKRPDLYFNNNVIGTLNLINVMLNNNINNLVFSSTAAVYGNPESNRIHESHIKNPINPYGKSKLIIENMLSDICIAYDFNATCLRYFNAAGAHLSTEIGEAHEPETHLIPNILKSILSDEEQLKIFGDDYDTPDGTCIRDYIHVMDLVEAHLLSLEKINNFLCFNLGNGNGFSIKEVINACSNITGKKVDYLIQDRRDGDPAILVADSSQAKDYLKWEPKFNNLEDIIQSAWNWHSSSDKRNNY
tara:strand:+ start:1045 stop:2022 length:978 start_codon:yes stop_codon:yes gene_type:complete